MGGWLPPRSRVALSPRPSDNDWICYWALSLQWSTMIAADIPMLEKEALDKYYCRVMADLKKKATEGQSFDELYLFIKLVLTMPHSNASVSICMFIY